MGIGTVVGKIVGKVFTKGFARKVGLYAYSGIFGTGQEVFTKSVRQNIFKNPSNSATSIFKGINTQGFWGNMGKSFEDVVAHEENLITKNGGPLKNLWKQIKDIPGCFSSKVKAGVRKASSASGMKMKIFGKEITHHSKLLGGLKGFGRAFMKKMPLLMGLSWFIGYVPNIVAAFKHGGFWTGVGEIAKSAGKLIIDVGAFMVGTAFGGLVGGLIVGAVGSVLGNKIFGKGYKEKMAEGTAPGGNPQTATSTPTQQQSGAAPAGGGQSQIYQVIDWQPPQMAGTFGYPQYQTMPGMNSAQQNMAWTNYQSGIQPQYSPQNQLAYQMPYQTPYQMPYMPQNQMMDFCNPFSMYGLGYV